MRAELKNMVWQTLDDLLCGTDPTKECLFVLMDDNARTGQSVVGRGDDESRLTDVPNDDGIRLLSFATSCKLARTNTFFITCEGGILRTHNGTNQPE